MIASNNLLLDFDPISESTPAIAYGINWVTDKFAANTTSLVYFSMASITLSEEAKQIISKLNQFKVLNENWDSYGAIPPSIESVEKAIRFVKKADKNLLPFYFTAPGPNGELVIEFRKGNREAAVYFNPDGTTELIHSENHQTQLEGSLEKNYRDLLNFING